MMRPTRQAYFRKWYAENVTAVPINPDPTYLDPNPAAVSRNRHHSGYYQSYDEWARSECGGAVEPANPDNVGIYPNQVELEFVRIDNLDYEINRFGQVRHIKNKKLLKPILDKDGYVKFDYWSPEKQVVKHMLVHRAVAKIFVPNPDSKPVVNHIDSNRQNHRWDNLEWCTPAENHKHAEIHGNFLKSSPVTGKFFHSKLTENQVINIMHMRKSITAELLANFYGVNAEAIREIWNFKTWKHVTKNIPKPMTKLERNNKILAMYATEKNCAAIGRAFRVSPDLVRKLVKKTYVF